MASYTPPHQRRTLNSDGTVNIHCRECGEFICKSRYAGYTSAICSKCQGCPLPTPPEDMMPEMYATDMKTVGTPKFSFQAVGFLKKVVKKVAKASVDAARRVKRRSLMDNPDETKEE